MILIISDLHFADGTTSSNVNPKAWQLLCDNIRIRAKSCTDLKEIRIVLLGDIFDFVRSDYWFSIPFADRPWNGKLNKITGYNENSAANEKNYLKVLNDIFSNTDNSCQTFFDELNKVADEYSNIPTKLTYIIANHDRPINLFPSLQAAITAKFTKFKEVEYQQAIIDESYSLLARHSHEWDSECNGYKLYNYYQKSKKDKIGAFDPKAYIFQSIGEPITMELMSGLINNLRQFGASDELLTLIKEANNVRPMTSVFDWLAWKGAVRNQDDRKKIYNSLRASIDGLLKTEFAKQWDNLVVDYFFKSDIVDKLQLLKKFIDRLDYNQIHSLVDIIDYVSKHFPSGDNEDGEHAMKELDKHKNIQFVVYGHTHDAKNVTFETSVDGMVKKYINTGTYLPLIKKIPKSKSFITQNQMTMTFLYRKEERDSNYPVCDFWHGTRTDVV
ncbi:MAG: hypothetical protein A2X64_08285 [Ignavibacteria bacterium GWF2_33_9]|nr:MAG: hypothetical protein A2X64_08285 [Ignavibacteria bacterium GWF2_33_9]